MLLGALDNFCVVPCVSAVETVFEMAPNHEPPATSNEKRETAFYRGSCRRSPVGGGAVCSTSSTEVRPAAIFIAPLIRSGFMPPL